MITGYNTDVRHGDVVFHVQTEDKGHANPLIESLVYVGGQVIAARRAGYAELLADGREDDEVLARMEKQHRTMIAAIRHGKFDHRVAELSKKTEAGEPPAAVSVVEAPAPASAAPAVSRPAASAPAARPAAPGRRPAHAGPRPATSPPAYAPASVPPAQAASPASPARDRPPRSAPGRNEENGDRTLDQVILEYLAGEAEQEQLLLTLEEGRGLAAGRRGRLVLRAASSRGGTPVGGAEVGVRLISTAAEPRALARGVTGTDGGLRLEFDIPSVGRGTAALIVTAVSGIGRAELKQLL